MQEGKGILASDESINSANKTLSKLNIEPTLLNRQRYRELIINTKGIGEYISGIILYDETIRQNDAQGIPFTTHLKNEGIAIGIKVDQGLIDLPNFPNEKFTQGLDNLSTRLIEYKTMGAVFAKWRAVITISDTTPSFEAIQYNMSALALYAGICQQEGIVPIVEPEVLYTGHHTLKMCEAVTTEVLNELFSALKQYRVDLTGIILKTGMVLAGKESGNQTPSTEVAKHTIHVLKSCVPKDTGGVVFLSGGQAPEYAIENLNEIGKLKHGLPWNLTFSYLRAIEGPPLELWQNDDSKADEARELLLTQLKKCTLASVGQYGSFQH